MAHNRAMKKLMLLIFVAGLPALAGGNGYAVLGMGTCAHGVANVSFAAGGDGLLYRGLAVGGDIGHYRFVERGGHGFGVAGLNAGYHFNRRTGARIEPFIGGGPAIAFGNGSSPGASFAGGVNYWFSRRVGLRLEGRVYGFAGEALAKFRVGISFR